MGHCHHGEILNTLGVGQADLALSAEHLMGHGHQPGHCRARHRGLMQKAIGNLYLTCTIRQTLKGKGGSTLVSGEGRKIASYPGNETVKVLRTDASGNIILAWR